MSSINYYDLYAEEFYKRTIQYDVSHLYAKFLPHIKEKAKILDAGCGVGRDAKHFQRLGHNVTAMDGSLEMVKKTTQELHCEALHLTFEEMEFRQEFDAIWASASLLHVPYEDLREVLKNFHQALRKNGLLFASFKYGSGSRVVKQRTFFDMDEKSILPYLGSHFEPIDIWKTPDNRSQVAPSPDKAWLNLLCKSI